MSKGSRGILHSSGHIIPSIPHAIGPNLPSRLAIHGFSLCYTQQHVILSHASHIVRYILAQIMIIMQLKNFHMLHMPGKFLKVRVKSDVSWAALDSVTQHACVLSLLQSSKRGQKQDGKYLCPCASCLVGEPDRLRLATCFLRSKSSACCWRHCLSKFLEVSLHSKIWPASVSCWACNSPSSTFMLQLHSVLSITAECTTGEVAQLSIPFSKYDLTGPNLSIYCLANILDLHRFLCPSLCMHQSQKDLGKSLCPSYYSLRKKYLFKRLSSALKRSSFF